VPTPHGKCRAGTLEEFMKDVSCQVTGGDDRLEVSLHYIIADNDFDLSRMNDVPPRDLLKLIMNIFHDTVPCLSQYMGILIIIPNMNALQYLQQ